MLTHCVIFFHNYAVHTRLCFAHPGDGSRFIPAYAVLIRQSRSSSDDGWHRIYPQKISLWHIALALNKLTAYAVLSPNSLCSLWLTAGAVYK